jgi:hypothetical protein
LMAQLGSLSQKVRVRLLPLNEAPESNVSISLKEVARRKLGEQSELQFVLDLQSSRSVSAPIPVSLNLDGERSQTEVKIEGQSLRWRYRIPLGARTNGGWGSFELPADSNRRDNVTYFVYGPNTPVRAAIVSADTESAVFFQSASTTQAGKPGSVLSASDFTGERLTETSLILWQEPLPSGAAADSLRQFAEEGGVVVFFAPGGVGAQTFNGARWGEVQETESDKGFQVLRWDQDQGPLARSDDRSSLPLSQVSFFKKQAISGAGNTVAAFEDGSPFLTRQTLGKGEIYFCASLPRDDWSSLGEGTIFVPMMQRLLQSGAKRLQQVSIVSCGELRPSDLAKQWVSVDAPGKDVRFQAGVYREGEQLMAVNRASTEDEPEVLDSVETKKLFGDLPFQSLKEQRTESPLQGEVWRLFLFALLVCLIVEGILILPARQPVATQSKGKMLS